MAEPVRGVNLLQSELERARESLKGVDDNIKKLTGRDPTFSGARQTPRRVSLGNADRGDGRPATATENRLFNLARRGIVQEDPGPRRRPGGAFARLGGRVGDRSRDRGRDSGDEEEFQSRPTLQSSVIAASAPREDRSRQNSIDAQTGDRKGQARNRRMFGLLLGTLQKFKVESLETKKKEEQRIEIEKKLEDKFAQEKEEILEERRQLFLERRRKQFRIKLIEQKMEMAQNHENWERETRKLQNFILTKAKPHIFYMPKILTPDSESKLKDTKLAVDAMIENRRKKLDKEIAELMSQVHDDRDDGHADDDDEDDDEGVESDDGHHGNGKENREEQGEEGPGKREGVLNERELRDKEREQRDRERRMKEARAEERKLGGRGRRESERRRDKGERRESEKSREREKGVKRESERSREREKGDHKSRERSEKSSSKRGRSRSRSRSGSRSRERDHRDKNRERQESGKRSSAKKKRHSDEHEGSSKSRRKSREEGKAEKKSKVWEPMEDEEEEEFVGSKDESEQAVGGGSIQSKMLQMAGMATVGAREGTGGGRSGKGDDSEGEDYDEGHGRSGLGVDAHSLSTDIEGSNKTSVMLTNDG